MIDIKEKKECCGCTACANICPKEAIQMKEDKEGFLFPEVKKENCVNCGLCDKVCPIKNNKKNNNEIQTAYIVRTKEKDTLKKSTSGGFFTPLAEYVIEKNGVVFGVGFDDEMNVIHKEVSRKSDIHELIGSKYVQSDLDSCFKKVKDYLENEKLVLFSGTPCQLAGLKSFLRKDYENLITMDLVCHGVPSKKLWNKYKEYQEKRYNSKIKNAFFRNKTYGYHSSTMRLVFENGKIYDGSSLVDYMLKPFYSAIAHRDSCFDCKFKSQNHITDFTVFDGWSASKVVPGLTDDDNGFTNVMINTSKAKEILDKIKDKIDCYEVDKEQIIKLDGKMVEKSKEPHKYRYEFYSELDNEGIKDTIKKYIPIKKKYIIWEKLKKYFYNMGLLSKIKALKKRIKKGV